MIDAFEPIAGTTYCGKNGKLIILSVETIYIDDVAYVYYYKTWKNGRYGVPGRIMMPKDKLDKFYRKVNNR
jgi:hypothetical protein